MDRHGEILQIIEAGGPPDMEFRWTTRPTLEKILPYFQLEESDGHVGYNPYGIEIVTRKILEESVTENTPRLLEKLATLTATLKDDSWHHSVCHNFERYHISRKRPSFLNDERYFPAATILVDAAIARLGEDGGSFGRIAGPIAQYNFDAIVRGGSKETFAFKPASFNDPVLQAKDRNSKYGAFWIRFAQSETPQAFIQFLADEPPADFGESGNAKALVGFLSRNGGSEAVGRFLEKILPPEEKRDEYGSNFAAAMKTGGGDQWIENAIASAEAYSRNQKGEITLGAFVDVEGTLLKGEELNAPLAAYISYLLDKGVPVTVFTGGDIEKLSAQLESLGIDKRVFPVKSKKDYQGQQLEVLVDDTAASFQPFGARIYQPPFVKPYGSEDHVNAFGNPDEFPFDLKEKWGAPSAPVAAVATAAEEITATAVQAQPAPAEPSSESRWQKIRRSLGL